MPELVKMEGTRYGNRGLAAVTKIVLLVKFRAGENISQEWNGIDFYQIEGNWTILKAVDSEETVFIPFCLFFFRIPHNSFFYSLG